MKLSAKIATTVLRQEAERAATGPIDRQWEQRIERLSTLCAEGVSSTHIAFLGTSILAKAVAPEVDLFAIKPKHAAGNENAYSARSLCHSVLVPLAAELGINIGVTGREPLNNQPYFRMTRLGDGTPVHGGAREAFDYMVSLVNELHEHPSSEARKALRAFVAVRRRYQPRYSVGLGEVHVTPRSLVTCIERLVQQDSEGGRRAQAVVAGLFDVFAGAARVESGRINDPSRRYPGDVCIRTATGDAWEKAVEVRDKPVRASDVHIFGKKCIDMGVREAAVVMVSPAQPELDAEELARWATTYGVSLTLFHGWGSFVDQVLFWSPALKQDAAVNAVESIEARLVAVEASPEAVALWQSVVRSDS